MRQKGSCRRMPGLSCVECLKRLPTICRWPIHEHYACGLPLHLRLGNPANGRFSSSLHPASTLARGPCLRPCSWRRILHATEGGVGERQDSDACRQFAVGQPMSTKFAACLFTYTVEFRARLSTLAFAVRQLADTAAPAPPKHVSYRPLFDFSCWHSLEA